MKQYTSRIFVYKLSLENARCLLNDWVYTELTNLTLSAYWVHSVVLNIDQRYVGKYWFRRCQRGWIFQSCLCNSIYNNVSLDTKLYTDYCSILFTFIPMHIMTDYQRKHIFVTAQPQPYPNSTSTLVGVDKVISWSTPTPPTHFQLPTSRLAR